MIENISLRDLRRKFHYLELPTHPTMRRILFLLTILVSTSTLCNAQQEDEEITTIIQKVFTAIEKNDTVIWKSYFLPRAYNAIVGKRQDSLVVRSRFITGKTFYNRESVVKERMRDKGVKVEVHGNIAMAWVPYDLWVDEKFSHCGIDVLTLMKDNKGIWKIATIAYSIEREGCNDW